MRRVALACALLLAATSADAWQPWGRGGHWNPVDPWHGPASRATVTGIEGLGAISVSGTSVPATLDCRGKDVPTSAGGTCRTGQTLTVAGSTAALTYGNAIGTANAADKAVTGAGTAVATDQRLNGSTSDGDITTSDIVMDAVLSWTDYASAFAAKDNGTNGWAFLECNTTLCNVLKLRTSAASSQVQLTTFTAGSLGYLTVCADRSEADTSNGAQVFLNGVQVGNGTLSARSASLSNAQTFAILRDQADVRSWKGKFGMFRIFAPVMPGGATNISTCRSIHQANLRTLSSKDYLFIGDSLTAGLVNYVPRILWPRRYGESTSTLIATINVANGGERCDQIQTTQWDAQKGNGYSRLFLFCGANDLIQGQTGASTYTEISTIVTEAKARGMTVTVMTMTPWAAYVGWDAGKQTQTDALNALIVANSAGADHVVDLYPIFESTPGSDTLAAAYNNGDGIHFNQAGHDLIATTVAAAIAP